MHIIEVTQHKLRLKTEQTVWEAVGSLVSYELFKQLTQIQPVPCQQYKFMLCPYHKLLT